MIQHLLSGLCLEFFERAQQLSIPATRSWAELTGDALKRGVLYGGICVCGGIESERLFAFASLGVRGSNIALELKAL